VPCAFASSARQSHFHPPAQTSAATPPSMAERLQALYPATRLRRGQQHAVARCVSRWLWVRISPTSMRPASTSCSAILRHEDPARPHGGTQGFARADRVLVPASGRCGEEVRGNGARTLAIFSDPDCPYCRRLEAEMTSLTDITIYTFLMPIASLHPEARSKAIAIWCSKGPGRGLARPHVARRERSRQRSAPTPSIATLPSVIASAFRARRLS